MSHLGDSGHMKMPMTNGIAGMKADPSCNRQAIRPVSFMARLAQVPRKMPKAVQSCHDMTKPPRILVGATSAEKTGTVTSFRPMPMPRGILVATSWPQFCVVAEPMGDRRLKIAPMKMVNLRPKRSLKGSEIHPALRKLGGLDCQRGGHLQERYRNIGTRVDETNEPRISVTGASRFTVRATIGDTEFEGPGQVGAIGAGLIPSLDGSGDGIEDDGEIKNFRMPPPMGDFRSQELTIGFVQLGHVLDRMGALCDQSTLAEEGKDVVELVLGCEVFHILQQLFSGNADQRILDPGGGGQLARRPGRTSTYSPEVLSVNWATLCRSLASSAKRTEPRFS